MTRKAKTKKQKKRKRNSSVRHGGRLSRKAHDSSLDVVLIFIFCQYRTGPDFRLTEGRKKGKEDKWGRKNRRACETGNYGWPFLRRVRCSVLSKGSQARVAKERTPLSSEQFPCACLD